jgi:hypothetical protein
MLTIRVTGQKFMTQQKQKINNSTVNNSYRLSVQVSLNGHSFLVTNPATSAILFHKENIYNQSTTPEEVLDKIKTDIVVNEQLQNYIDEVVVIHENNLVTIVPEAFFDETKAVEYLKFNSKILGSDFVAFDTITDYNKVVVYVPLVNVNNYFFEAYGSFQYFHSNTIVLKNILEAEADSLNTKIYLDINQHYFSACIIKDGTLQLNNNFDYRTPEDFVYYVLFCFEQLQLNPDSVPTILSGSINENDANYALLYGYVRNVSFYDIKSKHNTNDTTSH